MNSNITAVSIEDIKEALPKLSRQQLVSLDQELHSYLETSLFTRAGEESFKEWQDTEEDIYNAAL